MSELDKLKETITQMGLWIGIFSRTDISLIGWAVSNYKEEKKLDNYSRWNCYRRSCGRYNLF